MLKDNFKIPPYSYDNEFQNGFLRDFRKCVVIGLIFPADWKPRSAQLFRIILQLLWKWLKTLIATVDCLCLFYCFFICCRISCSQNNSLFHKSTCHKRLFDCLKSWIIMRFSDQKGHLEKWDSHHKRTCPTIPHDRCSPYAVSKL